MNSLNKATDKFESYLDTLPTIYLIGHWTNYGIMPFKFEKFIYDEFTKVPIPYVWYLEKDYYHLVDINLVTTGEILEWTFDKDFAEEIIDKLNFDFQLPVSEEEFSQTLFRIATYDYKNSNNDMEIKFKTAKNYLCEVLTQLGYSMGIQIFKDMEKKTLEMRTITIKNVLKDCEYDRIYIRTRNWDKYGVQVIDDNGYCVKDSNDVWSLEDPDSTIDLDSTICGFKWRGELDMDCPVLCVNLPTHWVEFDPETRRVKDMCQIHDGYQAYKTRLENARRDCD